MGAPSLPPLYCLPGCGHLFFTSGMEHGAVLSESERRPLGEISSLRSAANHLSPVRLLEQMEQLRPLNRLAALEIQARRSLTAANLFEQFECNPNPLRPQVPLGLVASPDSEPATSVSSQMRNSISHGLYKKIRGEKKPIPDEHKDDKYYERRKRNNQAAKKSRDARKIREDQIALRAAILEHENGILRAQLVALREEVRALRRLLWGNPSLISEQCSNT